MTVQKKRNAKIIIIGFLLTVLFLSFERYIPPANFMHLKLYDLLNKIEYILRKPPAEINDIVIVGIDNETAGKMPYRWPYPRSVFAKVITNLTLAKAKVIAFDFVFLGKSEDTEDATLQAAMANNDKIILASAVGENGILNIRSSPAVSTNVPFGVVTKLQDPDGKIRRALTYLISNEVPPRGFLSWELAILKTAEGLILTPIKGDECFISIQNRRSKKWLIPVDRYNKSFIINFRAHTDDFARLSFYNAYTGNFDPEIVRDKMALIGFVSPLLGDIHDTPLGPMPGIILNANSLLTLYAHNFISDSPQGIVQFLTVICVILSTVFLLLLNNRTAHILIGCQIMIFFVASYVLLTLGYAWNYFVFPFSVGIFPFLSTKIYAWIWQRKKFYWT